MNTPHEHVTPLKIYLGVAVALFILTGITVGVSFIDLGGWNAIVAVGVASVKAALVALFFMHLYHDDRLNTMVFLFGLLFVTLFIGLTLFDTLRRADIYEIRDVPIQKDASIYQNMPADTTQNAH
jgi:cytochrome c oxidase subunit IV